LDGRCDVPRRISSVEQISLERTLMAANDRKRVIFHGAVVVLVGLLCGLPAVTETGESVRLWHMAHEGLILIGIMMLTLSSVTPMLVLARLEAAGLAWSLVAMGYGFMTGLIIQGIVGARAIGPTTSPVLMIAFLGNSTGILGSVVATSLTIMGARAAQRAAAPAVRAT
jgi:hypothetical protein